MIYLYFFAGLATGAMLAVFSIRYINGTDAKTVAKNETGAAVERLNGKEMDEETIRKQEREKELQKQFNNMMAYTGKRQP